jgi:hypothetical protein
MGLPQAGCDVGAVPKGARRGKREKPTAYDVKENFFTTSSVVL